MDRLLQARVLRATMLGVVAALLTILSWDHGWVAFSAGAGIVVATYLVAVATVAIEQLQRRARSE